MSIPAKRVLLFNPPYRIPITRDYFCSKVSKCLHINPPIDLLILSGLLSREFDIEVLDAQVLRLSIIETLKRIENIDCDAIIFLSSSLSFSEDLELIRTIKEGKKDIIAIGCGDIFLDEGWRQIDSHPFIDGAIVDFVSSDIVKYLKGEEGNVNIIRRGYTNFARDSRGSYEIPVPRHELFPINKYHYPFLYRHPYTACLVDYGCPFKCNFCIMPSLSYRQRSIENVMEELIYIRSLGIKEVLFMDQTFGASRERAIGLFDLMISERIGLGWICWSRFDLWDEDMLEMARRAGCHFIQVGIESANEESLSLCRKETDLSRAETFFTLCRKKKIGTLATFIIGLPWEDEVKVNETIELARRIGCDYASFNVFVPRPSSDMKRRLQEEGRVKGLAIPIDQSGILPMDSYGILDSDTISILRRRAIRSFYLRPKYFMKRLFEIRSCYMFRRFLIDGMYLFSTLGFGLPLFRRGN
jgi:tRNA A37 methylthiotransferase MiaB